jgi:thioredoxin-like negative regulator of GroEL
LPHKTLLQVFELLGNDHPLVVPPQAVRRTVLITL